MSAEAGGAFEQPGGLDPRRAVQIIVKRGTGPERRGSGYQVAGDMVLTAAHVLADATSVVVRFLTEDDGTRDLFAEPVWSDADTDIALLRLAGDSAAGRVPPVRFARITRPPVNCEALGFPRFKLRRDASSPDRDGPTLYRDSHHARGTATSWSDLRTHRLEVDLGDPERDPEPGRSPWEGMSGAVVWSDGCVIGVIQLAVGRRKMMTCQHIRAFRELRGSVARGALRLVTAAGVAGGVVGVLGVAPAAADEVSLALNYTCNFPVVGDHPVTMRLTSDIPTTALVGRPTPRFAISSVSPVSASDADVMRQAGIKTIEGTADAKGFVAAPEGNLDATMRFDIPRTTVPDSGPFDVPASGTVPSQTYSLPGSAKIVVGNVMLHLAPRDANGNLTFLGKFDSPCRLDSGQNNVLASFVIAEPTSSSAPASSGSSGPGTGGAASSPPSGSTSPGPGGAPVPPSSGVSGATPVTPTSPSASGGTSGSPTLASNDAPASTGSSPGAVATNVRHTGGLILLVAGTLAAGCLVGRSPLRQMASQAPALTPRTWREHVLCR